MPDALDQVGDVSAKRSLVLNRTANTLRHLDGRLVVVPHVALLTSLLHGLEAAHATVALQSDSVLVEVFAGSLVGTGKHGSHHNARGTARQSFGNVSRGLDAAIGHDGDAVLARELGNVVDGRSLGTADGANLLGGADGSDAHTDTEAIGTGLDEMKGLGGSNDVAADDIDAGVGLLEMLDDLQLVGGITLGGVDDDDVHAGLDEGRGTIAIFGPRSDGGADEELLGLFVFGGAGEVAVLLQIGPGDEGHELVVLVDDGELALLGFLEELVGLLEADALLGDGELVAGAHELAHLDGEVVHEGGVAVGDDAHELAAHLAGVGDGDAGISKGVLDVDDVLNGIGGRKADGVGDEAIFVLLDLVNLGRLGLDAIVGVDDTDAALQGHLDGHLGFRDGVHRGRDEGGLQLDVLGELGGDVDLVQGKVNVAGHHDHIVIGVGDRGRVVAEDLLGREAACAGVERLLVDLPEGLVLDLGRGGGRSRAAGARHGTDGGRVVGIAGHC
mmetsp:Transcript_34767/g.102199  ORF Transcript_34767/g.102199 Transcript_34767/m.102199 type:complete len:501 (+) Transcript_34767:323-1825(+)